MDTLGAGGKQRGSVEDRVGEVLEDLVVLAAVIGGGDGHIPGIGAGERAGTGAREFAHGRLVPRVSDLVVFVNELAALGGDLEAVGAGGFAGGGDEHAGGAVGEFEVSRDVVLDFNAVIFAETAVGADAFRETEHPLEEIEVVRALVEQHAAALAGPSRAPAAGAVVGLGAEPICDDPIHAADFAELAGADEVADFLVIEVGALVEHRREDLFFVLVRGVEAQGVGLVDGDGFLDHHVEAGLKCEDAERGMLVMRGRDDQRVDEAGFDHVLNGRKGLGLGETGATGRVEV